MKLSNISYPILAAMFVQLLALPTARADEGWWLFSDPPRSLLKERYQFELTDAWLDQVRLASLRFVGGGSGSFVSPPCYVFGANQDLHHKGRAPDLLLARKG